jgi:hypothetical protein
MPITLTQVQKSLSKKIGKSKAEELASFIKEDVKQKAEITRNTFYLDEQTMEKMRRLAYWSRMKMSDNAQAAFDEYIANYESEHGELEEIPVQARRYKKVSQKPIKR